MSQYTPPPNDPVRATLVSEAARGPIHVVIDPPRGSWLGRIAKLAFSLLLLLAIFALIGALYYDGENDVHERWHSLSKNPTADKVAIISVDGVITGDDGFAKKQIDYVRDDDRVKAVVLRVDSPGGTVTGSDFIYHHLKKLAEEKQIPLVVSMGSMAASGGYYVAMAAGDKKDVIYAEPTTWTGSIGVIIPHYDVTGLLEKINVQDDSIASNPLKMMGSPTRRLPEPIRAEEQQILQGLVDSSFDSFKEIVLASRAALRDNKSVQDVVFTGRIFTARQALENHLVDRLGFVEDAIDRAIELAALDKDNVKVVKYKPPQGLFDLMLFGPHTRRRSLDLSAALELTVPRAYYLCSWMPGLTFSEAK